MKVIIVGGVAGGASTATRLRRMNEDAEIIILERGEYISFANCGLPYHIGDVITEREKLLVVTPEKLKQTSNIEARVRHEVVSIDRKKKTVKVRDLSSGREYTESYDKLVLSPGASPLIPPIEGTNLAGVFSLRSMADMDRIRDFIAAQKPPRAVVAGGGFIGLEIAENLQRRGMEVTIIEMLNQVMAPIDYEMAAMVHQHLDFKHVRLALGDGIQKITQDQALKVTLQSGRTVATDLVILSVGVRPESVLAKEAGLELGVKGAIKVDSHMLTSDPHIYALGDAAAVAHIISGKEVNLPLAGPASKQARIVADHICGRDVAFAGVQGTSIVKVFDLTVASTGLNTAQLKELGLPFQNALIHASNHAGYYPEASPLAIKLLFSPEGKIYGAQIVGLEGVDKRIDVIATAIRGGMSVYDLEKLELAYAPPYGSSRDPINIVGFLAGNILRGDLKTVDWDAVDTLDRSAYTLLDVRNPEELTIGMIEGAINIPLPELRARVKEIPRSKKVLVYCQVGQRGYFASRILTQHGLDAANLNGGYKTYSHAVCQQSNFDTFEHTTINSREEIREIPPFNPADANQFTVDACGLQCPGPILKLYNKTKEVQPGDVITVRATDYGFTSDVKAWADRTGNKLISLDSADGTITARIQKGAEKKAEAATGSMSQDKTMVIFSGDLDKAIAAFIIANGAASMGHKVTMFFTFWGLNILRKSKPPKVHKNFIERMFGFMMPRGTEKLTISQLNMGGAGTAMIKGIMKKKNVSPLSELMQSALDNGVVIQACQMSMDLMGIKKEELIDGIDVVGVATMIDASDDSNATMFI
ncbi:MAG: pyridine nucleotide-disulfide oxidoreductase [Anaerolineaceae bacterium]|jgi:NADPH-dependent 2,4-dienoyl-CoA reductase/sulfur reductase-like enzyme/peroxiredoxin family protein/rhodanese-related sulfurtransferase/TusA-related sulfurtransferase|nr:MAG: pyridine nucleotide-disulfide oxidoreductase [Anaerolineaceae bacterium]